MSGCVVRKVRPVLRKKPRARASRPDVRAIARQRLSVVDRHAVIARLFGQGQFERAGLGAALDQVEEWTRCPDQGAASQVVIDQKFGAGAMGEGGGDAPVAELREEIAGGRPVLDRVPLRVPRLAGAGVALEDFDAVPAPRQPDRCAEPGGTCPGDPDRWNRCHGARPARCVLA
jgi:hypothetical protein